ncbi:MAG: hypothetical protein JXR95_10520 [Deltaproteobacteria bacterium]|nr:hypothetical protein [Deltaproteobacteria bacterium]
MNHREESKSEGNIKDPFPVLAGILFFSTLFFYFSLGTNPWIYPSPEVYKFLYLVDTGNHSFFSINAFPLWNYIFLMDSKINLPLVMLINFLLATAVTAIFSYQLRISSFLSLLLISVGVFLTSLPQLIVTGSPVIFSAFILYMLIDKWNKNTWAFIPFAIAGGFLSPFFLLALPIGIFDDRRSPMARIVYFILIVLPSFFSLQYQLINGMNPLPSILRGIYQISTAQMFSGLILLSISWAFFLYRDEFDKTPYYFAGLSFLSAVFFPDRKTALGIMAICTFPYLVNIFLEKKKNLRIYSSIIMIFLAFFAWKTAVQTKLSSESLTANYTAGISLTKALKGSTVRISGIDELKLFLRGTYCAVSDKTCKVDFLLIGEKEKFSDGKTWIPVIEYQLPGNTVTIFTRNPSKAYNLSKQLSGELLTSNSAINVLYKDEPEIQETAPGKSPVNLLSANKGHIPVCSDITSGYFENISVSRIIEILRYEKITRIWPGLSGGRTVKFRMKLEDDDLPGNDFSVIFKPNHKNLEFASWKGEISAYRLAKMLGINNVPVAEKRTVNSHILGMTIRKMATDDMMKAYFKYISTEENSIEGAMIMWVSGAEEYEIPQSLIEKLGKVAPYSRQEISLLKQLSDMIILDFLTNNYDRFTGGNILKTDSGKLLFIDNGAAFGIETSWKRKWRFYVLKKLARISPDTWNNLIRLNKVELKKCLGEYLEENEINELVIRINEVVAHALSLELKWGPKIFFEK